MHSYVEPYVELSFIPVKRCVQLIQGSYHINLEISTFVGSSSLITYILYQNIRNTNTNDIVSVILDGLPINAWQGIFIHWLLYIYSYQIIWDKWIRMNLMCDIWYLSWWSQPDFYCLVQYLWKYDWSVQFFIHFRYLLHRINYFRCRNIFSLTCIVSVVRVRFWCCWCGIFKWYFFLDWLVVFVLLSRVLSDFSYFRTFDSVLFLVLWVGRYVLKFLSNVVQ